MDDKKKKKGVYYTPPELAKFIIEYLTSEYIFNTEISIFEPSCGDGVFIDAINKSEVLKAAHIIDLSLVEVDLEELSKIRDKNLDDFSNWRISFYNEDFLIFQENNEKKYDLIIGNPPYINKRFMSSDQIKLSNKILEKTGIFPANIKNIWTSFLMSAVTSLKENGVVCFVLPSELLQVKHSEPIRKYLLNNFKSLEIFTFNELIFNDIEQDTIVFIASNQKFKQGVYYHNFNSLLEVKAKNFSTVINNKINDGDDKWSTLFLSRSQKEYIDKLKNNIPTVNDFCLSCTGIVTAANSHFIVDNETVEKYEMGKYVQPIIKKSSYIKSLINFTTEDMNPLIERGIPTNLLILENNISELNEGVKNYLELLVEKKIHERYKCTKREKWYLVPSIWKSEGFFFKRSYHHPKVIINKADILVTDTAYRITMRKDFDINSFTFSFYNSLTLVFSELYGRFYGGGVLELTPNEFKKLPLPYLDVQEEQIKELDLMFREGVSFEEILNFTNKIILLDGLGFTYDDINFLNSTRLILLNRRLKL